MITIQTNAPSIAAALKQLPAKQLPFAKSLIANRIAQKVKQNEISVMKARLDRPTSWTLNSLYLDAATKADPSARVWFKDFAPKGSPAGKYLMPEVYGGDRKQKRSERALIAMGLMKKTQFLIPASGAKKDAYGNMPRGQVVQVLSALKALGEQGYSANAAQTKRSKRAQARNAYFWGAVDGEWGVWQRVKSAFGQGVKPIMLRQDRSPRYRKQFPFFETAQNSVAANYQRIGLAAIDEALRTMKPIT